jgi:hypothetical protein
MNFAKWTTSIAFANDLLIAVKAATVAEVENFTNMEMTKLQSGIKKTNCISTNKNPKLC